MGNTNPIMVKDTLPEFVVFPHKSEIWKKIMDLKEDEIKEWSQLLPVLKDLSGLHKVDFPGLEVAIGVYGTAKFYELLPKIAKLMKDMKKEFGDKKIKYLSQEVKGSLTFTKKEVSIILANAFFSTFSAYRDEEAKKYTKGLNEINFCSLFNSPTKHKPTIAKILMLLNYFDRVIAENPEGDITIEREYIPKSTNIYSDEDLKFIKPVLKPTGVIEDSHDALQADFANMFIGGGVIGIGCVQEEIRFAVAPECLVSMLVCPCMTAEEAIKIHNTEIYSKHKGYGKQLEFDGNFVDENCGYGSEITAMDAVDYRGRNVRKQFDTEDIDRDIFKCYVAFKGTSKKKVSTGNWGCGAFRGDKKLKFMQQWIAASLCELEMIYYTFERKSEVLANEIRDFVKFVMLKDMSIKELYDKMTLLGDVLKKKKIDHKTMDLFLIMKKLINGEKIERSEILYVHPDDKDKLEKKEEKEEKKEEQPKEEEKKEE